MNKPTLDFCDLGLIPEILDSVKASGYSHPTDIQEKAIPCILKKCDLIAIAPTGIGKTASFALPILQRLNFAAKASPKLSPRALILTPTRELAIQVFGNFEVYGKTLNLKYLLLHGGVSYDNQFKELSNGVDVIVATPGRLKDHLDNYALDLTNIEILVLDEADRMLDMGFIDDVSSIIEATPPSRQTLMFSATFSAEIQILAKRHLRSPTIIQNKKNESIVPKILHKLHPVDPDRKLALLLHLLDEFPSQQILVFVRTKDRADLIAKKVTAHNLKCMATHSGRTQAYRTKAMACFKDGRIQVLVATEIAARGLDIEDLPLVINYELPNLPEDYIHRIGRTGRAGAEGHALTLITQDELYLLAPIEALLKKQIEQIWVEGFYPKNFDPRVSKSRQGIDKKYKSKKAKR